MNSKDIKKLEELRIDDFIWGIYIFIVVMALISNAIERSSVYTKDPKDIQDYHSINIFLFVIAFLIYLYFLKTQSEHFTEKKDLSTCLSLIATILLVISGSLFIIAEIRSTNDDLTIGI